MCWDLKLVSCIHTHTRILPILLAYILLKSYACTNALSVIRVWTCVCASFTLQSRHSPLINVTLTCHFMARKKKETRRLPLTAIHSFVFTRCHQTSFFNKKRTWTICTVVGVELSSRLSSPMFSLSMQHYSHDSIVTPENILLLLSLLSSEHSNRANESLVTSEVT